MSMEQFSNVYPSFRPLYGRALMLLILQFQILIFLGSSLWHMFVNIKDSFCLVHCLLSSHSLNMNLFTGKLSVDIECQNTKVQNTI